MFMKRLICIFMIFAVVGTLASCSMSGKESHNGEVAVFYSDESNEYVSMVKEELDALFNGSGVKYTSYNAKGSEDSMEKQIEDAYNYIIEHKEVHELLLSGGDVLTLDTEKIDFMLRKFSAIEHLDVIRAGSRLLTVDPDRISGRLLEVLTSYPKVWYMSHFNHPHEVTEQAAKAAQRLVSKGVIILNQAVLMKGINDDAETMIELCQKLSRIKIKPHYLFHIDPVRGVRHFATGIQKGRELLKDMRGKLSSISTPVFAIDLPGGGGKVSLQYDYESSKNTFPDIENSREIYYGTAIEEP